MQRETDWLELWRELVELQAAHRKGPRAGRAGDDMWRERARAYDAQVKARWDRPDSSRDFVVAQLQAHPDWSALDIGGGTGAWAILMAQHARAVTVVEPSPAMREVLQENVAAAGARNVTVVDGQLPDLQVPPHDLTLCSHSMYGVPDFAAFVHNLQAVTRRLCVLVLRAATPDGVMAQAAMRILGQPHDSPNFQVAYNVLLQMGIFADVLMEKADLWAPWSHSTLEEALADVKRRLNVPDSSEHDAFLRDLLRRNLTLEGGQYVWPRGVRSALVHWSVEERR